MTDQPKLPGIPQGLVSDDMIRTCRISECRKYRYMLGRRWSTGPQITWCMLNPSIADADIDDPTIKRCISFSQRWGYGCLLVINIYALRATFPKELWNQHFPIGFQNTETFRTVAFQDCPIVCAWGKNAKKLDVDLFKAFVSPELLFCLGKNKDGSPKHPLYIKSDKELETYE